MAERFLLRPPPPIRGLGLSALADIVGAVMIVLGSVYGLVAMAFVGVAMFAFGIVLLVAAAVNYRKFTTVVETDERGIAIRSAGKTARRRWGEINQVSAQDHHVYLATDSDDGETLQIVCPRGSSDPEVRRMELALASRLDNDRGYHNL